MVSTVPRPATMTQDMASEQEKKVIYFNPNFCINNINVKDLVARVESIPPPSPRKIVNTLTTIQAQTMAEIQLPHMLPPVFPVMHPTPPHPRLPTDVWEPWDSRNPTYNLHLTSLAKDYVSKPKETAALKFTRGSQLPMLSQQVLLQRMQEVYNLGNAPGYPRTFQNQSWSATNISKPYLSDFVTYMMSLEREILWMEGAKPGATPKECRRQAEKLKRAGVNRFNFVSEHALDQEIQRREMQKEKNKEQATIPQPSNASWTKPQVEIEASLSIDRRRGINVPKRRIPPNRIYDEWTNPNAAKPACSSQLTAEQRREIFKNKVLKSGKNKFVKFKPDTKYVRDPAVPAPDPTTSTAPPVPRPVKENKFKLVNSTFSPQPSSSKFAVKSTLKYIRKRDPAHQDCRFYIKSGRCRFGPRCLRKHDPDKLPGHLKKKLARSRPKSAFRINNNPRPPVKPTSSKSVPLQRSASDFKLVLNRQQSQKAPTIKRSLAHKKIVNKALRWKRKTEGQKSVDCMFYIKRGACRFGDKCRRRHDPDKVAVCTQFIQGNCSKQDCLFQHKIVKDKMPLCLYFLSGRCSKETCPYLHVNTGLDVPVCAQFVKGHCDKGAQCEHRHTFHCERFFESGKCEVEGCTLKHLRGQRRPRNKEDEDIDADRPYFAGDDFIPVRDEATQAVNRNQISLEDILAEFGEDMAELM